MLILLGYILRKRNIISQEFQHDLGDFLITVVLPISILGSANEVYDPSISMNLVYSGIIASAYYVIAILVLTILSRHLPLSENSRKIFLITGIFANTGFIGMPLLQQLYGNEGMLYSVIYNLAYQLFFFSFGVKTVSGKKDNLVKSVLLDPGTIASIVAIVIFCSPFRFPAPVSNSLDLVGGMIVPLSMIIIGCKLSQIRLKELILDWKPWLVSLFRLMVFPITMLLIMRILGVGKTLADSMVVMTGLPAGALNVILAEKYHCEEEFAAKAVSLSTFLMIISLPLLMAFLEMV